MATIKAYTDLEQSKKLAKILPLESADMYYDGFGRLPQGYAYTLISPNSFEYDVPCWSLASLLGIMICPNLEEYIEGVWDLTTFTDNTLKTSIEIQDCKDPVNACVTMIEKLHKLSLL